MRRLAFLFGLVVVCGASGAAADPGDEASEAKAKATADGAPSWCAPEVEALADDVCHVGAPAPPDGRRTLVVFLHGAIAKGTTWSWTQERALARQAKQSDFEAIFPRAPLGPGGYTWPGSFSGHDAVERPLFDSWAAARRRLEARNGRPFDEVFVLGFSSGAYFVSSLALRGRLDVDGFGVFAGGMSFAPKAEPARRVPVFVGVCGADAQTAAHSRAFGATLGALGFPRRVDEEPVGHMFGDLHVAHALAYLRAGRASTPKGHTPEIW